MDHLYAALCLKTVRLYEAETLFQSNNISVTHVNINRTKVILGKFDKLRRHCLVMQTEGQRDCDAESEASDDSYRLC